MTTVWHTGLSVRGALRWTPRRLRAALLWIRDETGQPYRGAAELRDALLEELSQGREVLPLGTPCEGWSYKTGCPGHSAEEAR